MRSEIGSLVLSRRVPAVCMQQGIRRYMGLQCLENNSSSLQYTGTFLKLGIKNKVHEGGGGEDLVQ